MTRTELVYRSEHRKLLPPACWLTLQPLAAAPDENQRPAGQARPLLLAAVSRRIGLRALSPGWVPRFPHLTPELAQAIIQILLEAKLVGLLAQLVAELAFLQTAVGRPRLAKITERPFFKDLPVFL